jgi:mycoredoxin
MFTTRSSYGYRSPSRSQVPPIVVYGTSWCAASQMVRRFLDRLGVPYEYRDLEYDLDAARRVQWWTGGSFSHPTVQIGGQILVEPSLDEIDWVLSRSGVM